MSCEGRYAEAFDYGVMWMCVPPAVGVDGAVAGPNLFLTDATIDFTALDTEVLMPVRNATRRTYGKVTSVTATVLGTTNQWWPGDVYELLLVDGRQVAVAEHFLHIAAQDIHAARAASGGCDCTLSVWGAEFARKLNVIDAAVWHNCPCANPSLDSATRMTYLNWVTEQLTAIRDGRLELCDGETGSEFPAFGWAEQAVTPWAAAQIIANRAMREG